MERKFYTDNFEQLLKEKSDEFRMYPSKRVWHSIYNDLHPGRKWPSVAVSLILIIALLLTGYWNNKSTLVTQRSASSKNIYAAVTDASSVNTIPASQPGTVASAGNTLPASANTTNTIPEHLLNTGTTAGNIVTTPAASTALNQGSGRNSLTAVHSHRNNNFTTSNISAATTGIGLGNTQQSALGNSTVDKSVTTNNDVTISISGNDAASALNAGRTTALVSASFSPASVYVPEVVTASTQKTGSNENNEEETISTTGTIELNKIVTAESNSTTPSTSPNTNSGKDDMISSTDKKTTAQSASSGAYKKAISAEDKAWIEDYAFHNKSKRKKWQDRTAFSFYMTPGAGFSKLSNDAKYNLPVASPSFAATTGTVGDASKTVNKNPGLDIEAGFSINYSLAKKLLVKAGIQANVTSYGINAYETNHPVLTTLMLLDPNSGFPYMHSAMTTLSNIGGSQPVVLHNQTYQVSIPLGFAFKLSGNDKLAWYTGATVQPTFVAGGKAYLISADRNNYVSQPSLIRKWNLNTAIETYITYKFDGFTLQVGPQFRQQLLSTYYKRYTVDEKLFSGGLKLGIIKNF